MIFLLYSLAKYQTCQVLWLLYLSHFFPPFFLTKANQFRHYLFIFEFFFKIMFECVK